MNQLLDCDGFSKIKPSLLKALLRLSRESGLHPKCFPLLELRKDGEQMVAGGGFADIWKGLIQGQSVSVKVMRVYQDKDVNALLKVSPVRFISIFFFF
jgi:hypothetical protein